MPDLVYPREEFLNDRRRRQSPEWDYGVHWRLSNDGPEWPSYRVSWIVETGELYAIPTVDRGHVLVLAVIAAVGDYPYGDTQRWGDWSRRQTVEQVMDGWADGDFRKPLDWIRQRLAQHGIEPPSLPPSAARIVFKHEDEVGGQPIGPLTILQPGEQPGPRPFDPNRPPAPWVTLDQARAVAAEHGVELEEA